MVTLSPAAAMSAVAGRHREAATVERTAACFQRPALGVEGRGESVRTCQTERNETVVRMRLFLISALSSGASRLSGLSEVRAGRDCFSAASALPAGCSIFWLWLFQRPRPCCRHRVGAPETGWRLCAPLRTQRLSTSASAFLCLRPW